MMPAKKDDRETTTPSQNFIRTTSEVSHPMPLRIPISLPFLKTHAGSLFPGQDEKGQQSPGKHEIIIPPRQLKTDS